MRRTGARDRGRVAGALAAALLWAGCSSQDADPPDAPAQEAASPTAAPGAAAGIRGLRVRSRLVFEAMPEVPHLLSAVYVLPGRGLWRLEPEPGRGSARRIVYRVDDEVYQVAPHLSDSERLEGLEADSVILQMELRLAALLWPEGHAWQAGAHGRSAILPGVGSLEARGSAADGVYPAALVALSSDGSELERIESIEWVERGGRPWPRRWSLITPDGDRVREEITQVQPEGHYADIYFLPPDRLSEQDAGFQEEYDPAAVQQVVIPTRLRRRSPLPAGADWAAALVEAAALHDRCSPELSGALDPKVEVVLDERGQPLAVRLRRIAPEEGPPPEGWERVGTRAGASQMLADPRRIDAAQLRRLRETMAEPDQAGEPYALIEASAGRTVGIQLVVPVRQGP